MKIIDLNRLKKYHEKIKELLTAYTTKEEFNNLEIGGRNLYLGTKDFSGDWSNKPYWSVSSETYNGFTVMSRTGAWSGLGQPVEGVVGETYTFSGYVKKTGGSIFVYANDTGDITNNGIHIPTELNEWEHFSVTATVSISGSLRFRVENDSDDETTYVCGLKLENGNKVTPWTPAIEDTEAEIDNSIIELSMLGWSVPKECPIKNEVNGNQFIQKVGRTILNGTEDWIYHAAEIGVNGSFYLNFNGGQKPLLDGKGGYFTRFKTGLINYANMNAFVGADTIQLRVDDCTAPTFLEGTSKIKQWLSQNNTAVYYELETYNTMNIDGNEIGETVSDVRKETTVNLLKPTLATTTQNGVTCTNNGDGTYTLNGTASADSNAEFMLYGTFNNNNLVELNKEFRLIGCPNNTGAYLFVGDWGIPWTLYGKDIGNGSNFKITTSSPDKRVSIMVPKGITVDNLVFKPMITTNLNATYDDFVPYTGSTGQINSDVADIIDKKADKEKYGDTVVSVGRKADTTIGENSFAFGKNVTASGKASHAEGYKTTASNVASHAEGKETTASGVISHAEGWKTTASGNESHAEGNNTTASGKYSHAEGYETTSLDNQHAQGHYNNTTTATSNSFNGTSTGTAFVIGNGTDSSPSNAVRVTGEGVIYATNASVQTGADYAEYFEWSDGNPNNEDRVGFFVTFDESEPEKIRIANSNDDYILGIVSGMPSVIGNGDEDWKKRFVLDDFGRYIQETFEYVEDEETKTGTKWKENPEYDNTKPYAPRAERAEWSAIGLVGVLSVYDDGTCQVNGYCKCKDNGIAMAVEKGTDTYRVIKRVNDNIVKVVLK